MCRAIELAGRLVIPFRIAGNIELRNYVCSIQVLRQSGWLVVPFSQIDICTLIKFIGGVLLVNMSTYKKTTFNIFGEYPNIRLNLIIVL